MHKLSPASIYRLRSLATAGPRFYQVNSFTRRLEVLGMIAATGRTDRKDKTAEYRITDAGRVELEGRHGSVWPTPSEGDY